MAVAACPVPPPEAGLVQGLLFSVDCNVRNMTEAGYNALAAPDSMVATALTIMLTLYIAFIGLRLMMGRATLNMGVLVGAVLKIAVVLALATNWPNYQRLVTGLLFGGPQELAGVMLRAMQPGDSLLRGDPFMALQVVFDQLQLGVNFYSQRSGATASPFTGGPAFAAFGLNIAAFSMLLTTLGVVLAARIVLGMLLALGPLFIAFLLFDGTRGLFEGWLRACLAFAVTPLLTLMGLVAQLTLIEPQLIRLAALREAQEVDLAPAMAIFVLSLIFAGVSLAVMIAGGIIAVSLKPRADAKEAGGERALSAAGGAGATGAAAAAAASRSAPSEFQPRAAAVAAAAAAMERREARLSDAGGAEGRRITISKRGDDGRAAAASAAVPIGQSYRRNAAPRRAASSARRDR